MTTFKLQVIIPVRFINILTLRKFMVPHTTSIVKFMYFNDAFKHEISFVSKMPAYINSLHLSPLPVINMVMLIAFVSNGKQWY